MRRLLIVDDEQIVREALQAIILKKFPEFEAVTAKNGRVALELAKSFMPDLVLMDIKMPGMNGLEVIRKMKDLDPDIKFIMVTAYAEFEYAQTAIQLGVKDYLLKPSKASDVVQIVSRVMDQINDEKKVRQEHILQQNSLKKVLTIVETDVVTQLLFDHVHEIHLDELVELLHIPMTNEMFVMNVLLPQNSKHLYPEIKERFRREGNAWVGALYGRQILVIVFREKGHTFRSQAIALARHILSVSTTDDKTGWFIGIGNVCESLDDIQQSYQESLIAAKNISLPVKYRFYSDIPVDEVKVDGYHLKELENKLFDLIRNDQWEEVVKEILGLIDYFENKDIDLLETQQRVLELLWIVSRVLNEIGVERETPIYPFQIENFRQLRTETDNLIKSMWESCIEYYNQVEDDAIKQIQQYIMEHSHEKISLDIISCTFGLSPAYISKLFKEQLGVNYITFLTKCRLEKAKKLMLNQDKSLKEITFDVGYQDPNYFSKVFKRTYGVSPTEYRESLLGINI